MKRLLTSSLAICLSLVAFAQQSIPLFDRVDGHRVSFNYSYSLSRDGSAFREVTSGAVTVEGNAYRLDGLGLEIYSDGTFRWSLDREAAELVIENVDGNDIITNPALLMSDYRRFLPSLTVNSSGADSLDITYTVDEDTKARFVLTGVVFTEQKGSDEFTFDPSSLSSDFVITDLR